MTPVPNGGVVPQPEPQPSLLDAMKAAPIWLLWRAEPNTEPGKKPTKMPYYAGGGRRQGALDTPQDRARLVTFEAAQAAMAQLPEAYSGLAVALGPDDRGGFWQGIDLDDIEAKGLAPLANGWVRGAEAGLGYVEASPSGAGAHIIGYGRPFRSLGSNASGIEAYAGGRFFTFTGNSARADDACRPVDLADYVEQTLSPRHGAVSAAANAAGVELVSVDAKTVTELRLALFHMRADDYHLWYRMGLALRELGDTGRGLWMAWSSTSEKFDAEKAGRKWEGFEPRATGYQAVFAEAGRHGWVNPASSAAVLPAPALAPPPASAPRRFNLLVDGDLDRLPPLRWLVKGVVPDAGIGAIYGDSGTFKSFLTLDLLAHVSNGREWFGHRVRTAPTVYVPFEGQGGIPNRIRAWRMAETTLQNPDMLFAAEPDPAVRSWVAVINEPMNLRESSDRDALVETLTRENWAGGVLCIDTLAHACNGIDENSSAMGEMIGIFRDLQQRLGGVILLVHHSGKDQTRGMRGWSGLHAAMDFVIECQREGDADAREASFRLAKVKDGTTGTAFGFRAQLVPLGFDEDGDPVTSLTVCPREERGNQATEHPFKTTKAGKASIRDIDADTSARDDAFILTWAGQQVLTGNYPSKNSLKGQLPEMKATGYQITQDRVLAAVERLIAKGRLTSEAKSANGNRWLRPVEATPSSGSLA